MGLKAVSTAIRHDVCPTDSEMSSWSITNNILLVLLSMHTLQFLPKYDTCKHPLWISDQKQVKEPIKVRTEMVYRSEAMCGASGFIYLFLNIYILSVISLYGAQMCLLLNI